MAIERIFLAAQKRDRVLTATLEQLIQSALKRLGSPHTFVIDPAIVIVQGRLPWPAAEPIAQENVGDALARAARASATRD